MIDLLDAWDAEQNLRILDLFRFIPTRAPSDVDTLTPEEAWAQLVGVHEHVRRQLGTSPVMLPEQARFLELWPRLGRRARWLLLRHDAAHAALECDQTEAGEFELVALTLKSGVGGFYEAAAVVALPWMSVRAKDPAAPLRGLLAGLRRTA